MKYKMLITDFDDTLLGSDQTVSNGNLEAIEKFISLGGVFAINTGRMTNSILPIVKKIGLKGFIGCYQGGVIYDIDRDMIVRDVRLGTDNTLKQLKLLEEYDYEVHLYDSEKLYLSKSFSYMKMYEDLSGISATLTGGTLHDYAKNNNISASKIMIIEENQKLLPIKAKLEADNNPDIMYVLSKPIFLEVLHRDGLKGGFVRYMSEYHNIPLSQIIAVGDSLNDTDMIKVAGLGIAVANAHESLKLDADLVLPTSNDEDAIAYIINNVILGDE